MVKIVWRDLNGLATLAETFASLTALAETCLQAAIGEHQARLEAKHGVPRAADGSPQQLCVIGLGKLGGGELNLSSDIDVVFCFPQSGSSDGRRSLSNDQFFTRLARAVIASLADITEDGFCFRVDTRLRPFGDSGPLATSVAAMEQYYQREGRDWERYAMIKARPVAGDLAAPPRRLCWSSCGRSFTAAISITDRWRRCRRCTPTFWKTPGARTVWTTSSAAPAAFGRSSFWLSASSF
jgi:glutamate-ammonia-ligase adenylyltransferase